MQRYQTVCIVRSSPEEKKRKEVSLPREAATANLALPLFPGAEDIARGGGEKRQKEREYPSPAKAVKSPSKPTGRRIRQRTRAFSSWTHLKSASGRGRVWDSSTGVFKNPVLPRSPLDSLFLVCFRPEWISTELFLLLSQPPPSPLFFLLLFQTINEKSSRRNGREQEFVYYG